MNNRFNLILNFLMKNNKIRTFIFFFFISGLLWIAAQLAKKYRYVFKLPVNYEHLPSEYYKDFLPNDTILVTIKTTGYQIIKNKIEKPVLKIDISKQGLLTKKQWSPAKYRNKIKFLLGNNSQIEEITPKKVLFKIHRINRKHVAVQPQVVINFKNGYKNTKPAEFSPDSIWIYGDRNILDTMKQVKTKLYRFKNIDHDINMTLTLQPIKGLKYSTNKISYHLPVAEIIEEEIMLPLKIIGKPKDLEILLIPKKIKLKYKFFKDHMTEIQPQDFEVIVNFRPGQDVWQPVITKKPVNTFDIQISPRKINYLIKS